MDDLFEKWTQLAARLIATHPDISPGKMMSADALTYDGKVFAFFSTKGGRVGLGGRIGREYDIASLNLTDWQHLAPFKTKPPMKDWIVVGAAHADRWSKLAEIFLDQAKQ